MCLVTRCLLSLLCSIMGSLSLLYFHCCECWYFIETEPIFSGLGEKLACVYLGNKSFIKISALVPDFLSQTVDILAEKWADTTKLKRQHAGVSTLHAFFMYIRILFFFFLLQALFMQSELTEVLVITKPKKAVVKEAGCYWDLTTSTRNVTAVLTRSKIMELFFNECITSSGVLLLLLVYCIYQI